jgi:hypothetical protein
MTTGKGSGDFAEMVEPMGFEPTTSTVQTSRSPN